MKAPADLKTRSPESIEWEIAATRASMNAKMQELERRLDPRHRLGLMKANVRANAARYQALGAVAAIAAGASMAVRGWGRRRWRAPNLYLSPDHPALVEVVDLTCD